MNRVVYILGAGFSAPFGLPLVPNFLTKAKDLYFEDPATYREFAPVLERIARLSTTKNYFSADLFNIEEILSILEMEAHFGSDVTREHFTTFLARVISAYTPSLKQPDVSFANWTAAAFPGHPFSQHYGWFVAELCRIELSRRFRDGVGQVGTAAPFDSNVRYSVITLNYDLVLESMWDHIVRYFDGPATHGFKRLSEDDEGEQTPLIKLHGSIDTNDIVPPTWSKGVHPEILPAWRSAFRELSRANHVRLLGYSLPEGDSYVRYLLKAAVPRSEHLKTIQVLCHDPSHEVEQRFKRFIDFNFFSFKNGLIQSYLGTFLGRANSHSGAAHAPGHLEEFHEEFFR